MLTLWILLLSILFLSSKFDLDSCHAVVFELVIFNCSSKKKKKDIKGLIVVEFTPTKSHKAVKQNLFFSSPHTHNCFLSQDKDLHGN